MKDYTKQGPWSGGSELTPNQVTAMDEGIKEANTPVLESSTFKFKNSKVEGGSGTGSEYDSSWHIDYDGDAYLENAYVTHNVEADEFIEDGDSLADKYANKDDYDETASKVSVNEDFISNHNYNFASDWVKTKDYPMGEIICDVNNYGNGELFISNGFTASQVSGCSNMNAVVNLGLARSYSVEQLKKDIGASLNKANRELSALWKLNEGITYEWQTDNTQARTKTVPTGACEYAIIDAIGGMCRKGKNLLNPTLATTTQNGVTCTKNADGTYTLNGTATANTAFDFPQMTLDVANKKLLGCPSGGSSTTYFMAITDGIIPSSDYGEGVIISNATKSSCYVRILIRSGVTANNLVFKPMITTDTSLTYADYEPYTDSLIDSPTDKVVSASINVLPFPTDYEQKTINGITFTRQGGVVTLTGTATSTAVYRVNLIKGFNIPISIGQGGNGCLYLNNSFTGNTYIQFCNADTVIDGWGINVINRKHSTYSSMGGKYADNILVVVNTGQTYGEGVTFKLMFSDNGSTNAEFMPYYSSTNTIPTAVINKCPDYGIGISADVNNTLRNTSKNYSHKVKKVDMGTLDWTKKVWNENYWFEATLTTAKPPASNSTKFNGLCAKYAISTYANSAKPSVAMSINSVIAVTDATYNEYTAEQFKNAMQGVYLYYELAEEEIIDLSDVWVEDMDIIQVESGGTIQMHYPDYDKYVVDMPNTETYAIKLSEVQNG